MTREELVTAAADAATRAFPDRAERLLVDLQIRLWWNAVPPAATRVTIAKHQLDAESHCALCGRGWEEAWRTQPNFGWALKGKFEPFAICAVCVGLARAWSTTEKVDPGMARTELLRALRSGTEREQKAADVLASQKTTLKAATKVRCEACHSKGDEVELVAGLHVPLCTGCLVLAWTLPDGKRFDTTWELYEPGFARLGIVEITAPAMDAFFQRAAPLARQRQLEVRRHWGTELVLATEGGATITFAAPQHRMSASISCVAGNLAKAVLERWRTKLKELVDDILRGAGTRPSP